MRIAALMPLKIDEEKTRIAEAARQAREVADEFIILFDKGQDVLPIKCTESIQVRGGNGIWDDFANRMALWARAAKYGCNYGLLLDDDETLGPSLTRERCVQICTEAAASGQVVVSTSVRTAWNDTHWRTDGIFEGQNKPLFIANPLMGKNIALNHTYDQTLHFLPRLAGPEGRVPDYIVHWGLRTPNLRQKNVAKYLALDPTQKFSNVPYDYLLDERTITLEPL